MGCGVADKYRCGVYGFTLGPSHKIIWLVRFWLVVSIAVDIGQQRTRGAMAQVGNLFAKRFQLVVSKPFGEFIAAYFKLGLSDAFAKFFG